MRTPLHGIRRLPEGGKARSTVRRLGDAEMRNLIETYRQDAEDERRLADTIFERAEMLDTKEETT